MHRIEGEKMVDVGHVLDQPVWSALNGADATLAIGGVTAKRYRTDVSPFAAVVGPSAEDGLQTLRGFATSEYPVVLVNPGRLTGWTTVASIGVVQMTGVEVKRPVPGIGDIVELGDADVPDMVELTALTKPGPFAERTFELGGYVGVRENGRLIAMAGERMHPDGWAEVSAVCTHPDYRGRGLGARVVLTVSKAIRERGILPFLHVAVENTGALRLYQALGFEARCELPIEVGYPA
jgi:ribosomal protein S18 acetylase RimI-like enzyme